MPLRGSGCPGLGESAAVLQSFFGVNTLCACTRWGPQAGLAEAAAGRGERRRRGNGGRRSAGSGEPRSVGAGRRRVRGCLGPRLLAGKQPREPTQVWLSPAASVGAAVPGETGANRPQRALPPIRGARQTHALYVVFRGHHPRASRRTDAKWR